MDKENVECVYHGALAILQKEEILSFETMSEPGGYPAKGKKPNPGRQAIRHHFLGGV